MAGRSKEPTETVSHGTIRLPNEIVDQVSIKHCFRMFHDSHCRSSI